jgi:hypothetical protein
VAFCAPLQTSVFAPVGFQLGKREMTQGFNTPALTTSLSLFCVNLLMFLAACTIKLVPLYDPSIVNGLNEANEQTLTLFSSVAAGSSRDGFLKLSNRYD